VFTKLTGVTRKFGFYIGSTDHVSKENVGCVNTLFLLNSKA